MAQDPRALLQKADKAAASAGGGFSFFGGREEKWGNAANLYIDAANAFRLNKQNKEAGQAFEKCAAIQTQHLNEPDDAANSLTEAYKVYRLSDPVDAARCLEVAINRYTSKGNFRRAATHKHNLGEMYAKEIGDLNKAIESYELAATWFESDNAGALANKSWLEAADHIALAAPENGRSAIEVKQEYYKATGIFEKVAASSVSNKLMQYSVKGYLLKAGYCHLAAKDPVTSDKVFATTYKELDPTFETTTEYKLLIDMSEQIKAGSEEGFEDVSYRYYRLNKMDPWATTLYKRIKESIEPDDFS